MGTDGNPFGIPAGGSQSFVLALSPTAAFPPTDVSFTYVCANSPNPAPILELSKLPMTPTPRRSTFTSGGTRIVCPPQIKYEWIPRR